MISFLLRFIWSQLVFLSKVVRALFIFCCVLLFLGGYMVLRMPGNSYDGPLPPLTPQQANLEKELRYHVNMIAEQIGERHIHAYQNLMSAADYITYELENYGYSVDRFPFTVHGKTLYNLVAEIPGKKYRDEILIIGTNYDSYPGSRGANENGSGVAAVLSMAKYFSEAQISRTLRFVFFPNSYPPFSQSPEMGSMKYARLCASEKENIVGMLHIASLGYYSNEENSQDFPIPLKWLYPRKANFVMFSGNTSSIDLVKETVKYFRENARFPSEGITFPDTASGIGIADQWAFWQHGYPALMITDTSPYRYPYHHSPDDTPNHINFEAMSRVVSGLEQVVGEMVYVRKSKLRTLLKKYIN
ncbi:MAG: M28 family peptidase [Calditrichaeota bacterium]|nr:MAG: M28 family peptidase [Calditrichota bacterium]